MNLIQNKYIKKRLKPTQIPNRSIKDPMNASSHTNARSHYLTVISTLFFCWSLFFCISLPAKNSNRNRFAKNEKAEAKRKKNARNTLSTMEFPELVAFKQKAVANNQKDVAVKCVERLLQICQDSTLLAPLCIELADLKFDLGEYEQAIRLYTEFCTLYPGNKQIEYAEYRSIVALELCTLSIDRDQTKTEDTITRCKKFLVRNSFNTYKDEVSIIQKRCYQKLVESDLQICEFYLKNKVANSPFIDIENRIETIRSAYLPYAPEAEPLVLSFEIACAEKRMDHELLKQKEEARSKITENSQISTLSITQDNHKKMAHRF